MAEPAKKKEKISADCLLACLYLVCLPFTVVTTPIGSLLKVMTYPIFILLAVRYLMGKNELVFNYIHLFYTLYILYSVGMLLVYNDTMVMTTTKDMILGLLMLLLITLRVYNAREKEWLETAWILVGIVCIFAAITSTEVVSESENRTVVRILGFEEDQNQFCAYLIMPVLISLKRIFEKRRFFALYVLIVLLAFYAILKTGSRGGLIGVCAGVAVYIFIGMKSLKARIAIALAAVLTVLIFISVVMPMLPEDVSARYSVEAVREDGGSGRFEIWSFLLNYSAQRPERLAFGSGVFSTYPIMHSAGFRNGVAHNAYIQVLSDEGLAGLCLFLVCIVLCLVRNIKKDALYACAMISLLVFSMSLSFYVFKPYLNIMIMCATSFAGTLPQDRITAVRNGGTVYDD